MAGLESVPVTKKDKKRKEVLERLWKRQPCNNDSVTEVPLRETHEEVSTDASCSCSTVH